MKELYAVTRCYKMPWGWDCYYSEFIYEGEIKAMAKCEQLQAEMAIVPGIDYGFEPITKKDAKRVRKGEKVKLG